VRSRLENILRENQQCQDFEVRHEFEHIGLPTVLVNAYRMTQVDGTEMILLAIEDATL
jgi:two-component system CheB/CheR fusion protein